MQFKLREILSHKCDITTVGPEQARASVDRRGFARTVRAKQRNNLTLVYFQRNTGQCLKTAIIDMDLINCQHCVFLPDTIR